MIDASEYPGLGHPMVAMTAHTYAQFRTSWVQALGRHLVPGITKCGLVLANENAPFADALVPRHRVYQSMWCPTCRPVGT